MPKQFEPPRAPLLPSHKQFPSIIVCHILIERFHLNFPFSPHKTTRHKHSINITIFSGSSPEIDRRLAVARREGRGCHIMSFPLIFSALHGNFFVISVKTNTELLPPTILSLFLVHRYRVPNFLFTPPHMLNFPSLLTFLQLCSLTRITVVILSPTALPPTTFYKAAPLSNEI